jgi:integrase/recombinase XerC
MTTTLNPHIRTYLRARYLRGEYNHKSLRVVGPRLRTFDEHFGNRPLNQLTRRAVEAWLESLHRLAPNSRAAYLASVRQFTAWMVREQIISSDPCNGVAKVKRARSVPRAQTSDAVARTLSACRDSRDLAIIWLMVGMGLRRCEVAWARWENYDDLGRTLRVLGKAGHERVLPVPVRVAAALSAVRARGNTGPIITSKLDGHSPVQPETVGMIAGRILRDAGVKHAPYDGVAGHALRHTCASDVLDGGASLTVVQEMLGHVALSSTSIYLRRASIGQMRDAMEGRTYTTAA